MDALDVFKEGEGKDYSAQRKVWRRPVGLVEFTNLEALSVGLLNLKRRSYLETERE